MKNALVDLYLLSDSDALIVCHKSGFGLAALAITRAEQTYEYKTTFSLLANFNGTYGLCQVERDAI